MGALSPLLRADRASAPLLCPVMIWKGRETVRVSGAGGSPTSHARPIEIDF